MREIDVALVTWLAADATLMAEATGVFRRGGVPTGQAYPYIEFHPYAPAGDDYTLGGWASISSLYLVQAIDRSASAERAQRLAERVHALLTDAALTVTGYALLVCRRRRAVELVEQVNDTAYQYVGGIFEIEVSK
ncbi:MAG: DUF3168 domain-containing protein [Dehalococcoidales bacterium]|nr:DUF3168 domain-containing protein [Dehalococcoidales bacterium]